jgi:glycosyltransferase involved in cell wall biosynthesis
MARIVFDGLNLALPQGTGIATYTRNLIDGVCGLGHKAGVLYATRQNPAKDPLLREIGFFDERRRSYGGTPWTDRLEYWGNLANAFRHNRPIPMNAARVVHARQFQDRLPAVDDWFVSPGLFARAHMRFDIAGDFLPVTFDTPPDIMHCTYQHPLKARRARNLYTIHDLVALRLPFTTMDRKRKTFQLLRKIARQADHIVTVSENSRRDIIEILGADASRVTNTYQSVCFPPDMLERPPEAIAEQLSGSLGLDWRGYLLFFGAMEPKKNIARIIDAYQASGVDIPLVLVTSNGWENEAETKLLQEQLLKQREKGRPLKRRVVRFEYVSRAMLVTLLRGARALLFPSLYEGFGLPVLEAMSLGTPVVTSNTSSLPEVAGDAALVVDPYDSPAIARAIATVTNDAGLRDDLARRGLVQAGRFSPERYRERLAAMYAKLA